MRRRHAAQADPEAHAARLAWWAAFLTTVVLVLALSFVRSADAATLPATPLVPLPQTSLLESEEAEDGEEEGEICELEEDESEEGEEEEIGGEECEFEEEDETPPSQCKLESADAAVSADLAHHKLHLAVRYTAYSSSQVTITYWLRGSKGPLNLEPQRKHFGRAGVFRASQELTPAQAKKVAAARSFTIEVRPASAPGYCRDYLDQELTVRRGGQSGPVWIDSESTFRSSRHA
jgi:hypothetical protein